MKDGVFERMDWKIKRLLMFCLLILYVHKIMASELKEVYVLV